MEHLYGQLTASNTVRDQKTPYTIYEIEVRSSSTIKWVIYRRYSDFFTLHSELLKIIINGKDGTIRLPYLPPKRLTRSLAVDFVEKRKRELQTYLTELLRNRALVSLPCVLQFLAVPDSIRPMVVPQAELATPSSNDEHAGATATAAEAQSLTVRRRGQIIAPEERKVREFVTQLNTVPNKVHAIRSFQQYFFSQRPRLSSELIDILFEGTGNKETGLILACGDLSYSVVTSKAALELICKLIDVEKNKDAQLFLDVLSTVDIAVVKKLNLHRHILMDRAGPAFQLAHILSQAVGGWTVEKCLLDVAARQEFQRWVKRKQILAGGRGVIVHREHQHADECPILTRQFCRTICDEAFENLHRSASSDQGWRAVYSPNGNSSNSSIQIVHKQVSEGVVMVRIALVILAEPSTTFRFWLDHDSREQWCLSIKQNSHLVSTIDDTMDIIEEVLVPESYSTAVYSLTTIRSWREEPDGTFAIAKRSAPKGANFQKTAVSSGTLLMPIHHDSGVDSKSTFLIWFTEVNSERIPLVIADLLGESDALVERFARARRILEEHHASDPAETHPH